MKLLVDLSIFFKPYEGIMVYALNILSGFQKHKYKDIKILCHPDLYNYIHQAFPEFDCIIAHPHPPKKLFNSIFITKKWYKQIKEIDCDIVFSPYPYLYYLLSPKPVIQTIHDLQQFKIQKGITLLKSKLLTLIILKRSYRIITISNFVKKEIHRSYPLISQKKIRTIYNGINIDNSPLSPPAQINTPYLLYVSTLWKYKNIITLVKAFNLIKEQIPHKLIIVGKTTEYWENEVCPFIIQNKLQDRIMHIKNVISNEELTQLYQHTDLFIHPSLMEGFGFTPIEAAIQKVPVITTTETAIKETTLGFLNYFTPATSETSLAHQIIQTLQNPPSASQLEKISKTLQDKYNYIDQSYKVYDFINNSLKTN